jgi:sRNA-binding regulator protein Hfq
MRILLIILLSIPITSYCQPSDFLALKKKNGITIKSYFPGIDIDFYLKNGLEVSGVVHKVDRDTIFITYHDVRMAYTMWGTQVPDTVTSFDLRYAVKDIVAIAKQPGGLEFVRDGSIFIIGGTAYAALHLINSGIQHAKVNWKTVGISVGVAAVGVVMKLLRKRRYDIGNKYQLTYIKMK